MRAFIWELYGKVTKRRTSPSIIPLRLNHAKEDKVKPRSVEDAGFLAKRPYGRGLPQPPEPERVYIEVTYVKSTSVSEQQQRTNIGGGYLITDIPLQFTAREYPCEVFEIIGYHAAGVRECPILYCLIAH